MSLTRQGRHYLAIGILQWLLDWGVMVALSHGGLSIETSNLAGRVTGAALGFWLNGRITFAGDSTVVGHRQFARICVGSPSAPPPESQVHMACDGAGQVIEHP